MQCPAPAVMQAPLQSHMIATSCGELPQGVQRLRLGHRNEVVAPTRARQPDASSSTHDMSGLVAERDCRMLQQQDVEKKLKQHRKELWDAKKKVDRQIKDILKTKENILDEADKWKKQLEVYGKAEVSTMGVLQDRLLDGNIQTSEQISVLKATLNMKMREGRAEIQRELGVMPKGAAEEQRSAEELEAEIQRWQELHKKQKNQENTAIAPVTPAKSDAATSARPAEVAPPAAAATENVVSSAPPKAAVKGKGKGKPAVPKPPPPGGKGGGPAGAAAPAPVRTRQTKLVTLGWTLKKSSGDAPHVPDCAVSNKLSELVTSFGFIPGGEKPAPSIAVESPTPSRHDSSQVSASSNGAAPAPVERQLQETVFKSVEVQEMPEKILEYWFKKQEVAVKIQQREGASTENSEACNRALLDQKCLQMIGIVIQRYKMSHKGESEKEAAISIKRGVLSCDLQIITQELMALLRIVIQKHAASGSPVLKYVEAKGDAALDQLECADYHRFVYELLKVPQVDERFECMLFESEFDRIYERCEKIQQIRLALSILNQKRPLFCKFFCTAHRLGQALNRDCKAPQASRGFQLASLEKFAQTKTTRSPKHNLLHVVLALMQPSDVSGLVCSAEEMRVLKEAKSSKIGLVYAEIVLLKSSFDAARDVCEKGSYTRNGAAPVKMERRRKTRDPSSQEAERFDDDDTFHEHMKQFVDRYEEQVKLISGHCGEALRAYEDLAIFFDDVASVYPPPRKDNDPKSDLIAILHDLIEQLSVVNREVNQDKLRELMAPDIEQGCM